MDSVKRQDMAAFLRREAKRLGVKDAASWKPSDKDWKQFRDVTKQTPHAEDVLWLAHANVSTGWPEPDGSRTFRGMDPVRRQDMAAFLYRLAVKAGRGGGVRPGSF
ncbi:GH25 family lysozyme, partial [Bifidobacterium boum]